MIRNYDPAQDSWANAMNNASNAFTQYLGSKVATQNNMANNDARRAMADKYRTEALLNQAQLDAPTNLNNIFKQIFSPQMEAPSENFVGPMNQYDSIAAIPQDVLNNRFDNNKADLFTNAMRFAGNNPGNLGKIYAAFAANAGASPEQLTRAQMGAGMNYANTKDGFEANQNKPFTLSPGSIRYDAQGNVLQQAPFKPGGSGPNIRVLPDGTVEYGENGLAPGKSTRNDLEKEQVASAKLRGLLNYNRELAKKDPTNFGVPGFVKGRVQDISSLAQGVSDTLGYNSFNEAVGDVRKQAMQNNVDPSLLSGVFDPNLPALETAADLLVFQAASALAGQSGRALSDNDVKYFKNIVGSPTSLFSNQEKYLAKLDTIENLLGLNQNVTDRTMGGNITGDYRPNNEIKELGSSIKPGTIDSGFKYLGGDPNDQNNWEQVQ